MLGELGATLRVRNGTEVELLHGWGCQTNLKDCLAFKDKSGTSTIPSQSLLPR